MQIMLDSQNKMLRRIIQKLTGAFLLKKQLKLDRIGNILIFFFLQLDN